MGAYIAGIDPGTTTALVVIDEDKKVILNVSKKNFKTEEIINILKDFENLVLIAIDKKEIPKKVREIASKIGIGIYSPKEDISLKEKDEYYRNENLKKILNNIHEFDAYISASFASDELKEFFEKAKKVTNDEKEYVRILKINLKNRNLEPYAVYNIMKEKKIEKKEGEKRKRKKEEKKKTFENIRISIKRKINKEIEEYKKKIEEKNREIIKLENIINILSKELVKYLNESSDIVPKLSFIKRNKISKASSVFLDDFSDESIVYLKLLNPKRVYLNIENEKVKELKEYYFVEDFENYENFVLIKKYTKKINEKKEDDYEDIKRKIKKLLEFYS